MTEIHEILYPPKEPDTLVIHRRYDGKERLVAWSTRQDDHYLLFRVNSFREVTLKDGETLDVPQTIECRFSQTDVDPDAAFADGNDESTLSPYTWTGREFDAEIGLQYNKARCYDPTVGRWISESPLGFEPADGDLYPYVKK